MNSNTSNLALVQCLVKQLKNVYPDKQIGRTLFQKLMYLYSKEAGEDFGYEMYHYGPFSYPVSGLLDLSEKQGLLNVMWDGFSYYIDLNKQEGLSIDEESENSIKDIVAKFGKFNAKDLSIIATAYFLIDEFGIKEKEIVNEVKKAKPNFEKSYIKKLLRGVGII